VTLCLVGAVMSASLNGTVNNDSDVHDHVDHNSDMHEHDSNAKIFLSLLINSTASNSTSNNSTSKPKVRDVNDDVKSLNDSSEFDALNSTEKAAANATNQLRRRQVDVKALNDTDALNSTKAGNETSQLRGIIIIKNRDVDQEDEEDFLLEGPEGIEADDENNSTTRRPKLRDLDDVILKALNATEEEDEEDADNSTNKAWSNSRLQERAATLNASLTSSNETRLNSTDMAATNKTVRAAGNETLNGTDSQVNATTTTTTASPWSILPFFRDLTKAKEEVNDTKEAVDKLNTRSVFIVETLNDDIEDDASSDVEPDSEPSEEDRSASSNSTTTAHPQDEN